MSRARPFFHPEPSPEPTRGSAPIPIRRPRHRWPRFFAWVGIIALGLIVLVAVVITVLLHSQKFHNYILGKAQAMVTQSLNAQVTVQNFALHFSPLGLDVYGVVVHGAKPYSNPPLLQLQHAHIGIGISSFIHHEWYLTDLRLDHPVAQIFVDKNGVSNIPKPKPSNSKSNTTIWDLGIRHMMVDQAEIGYNSQTAPLSADLHDLQLLASFNAMQKMYSGNLKYTDGHVLFGRYRPFVHSFNAAFDLTPSIFRLRSAQLSSSAIQVNLKGTATDFSAPHVQAGYDVTIDGAQIARITRIASVPAGLIHLAGSASYQQATNVPALETVSLSGELTSRRLMIRTASLRAAIDDLAAHYSLDRGDAVLHDLHAGILGGRLTVRGTMKNIGGAAPHSEMTASLQNISLAAASRLVLSASKQPVAISGVLNADAHATWGKTINDLVAKVDSTIRGNAFGKHTAASTTALNSGEVAPAQFPIDSDIHATYTAAKKEVTLRRTGLRTPQTTLTLNGTVGERSSMAVAFEAKDLRELASIADIFRTPPPGQSQSQPLDLAGSASFNGNVSGSTSAPHLTGQLVANNLRFNGSTWKHIRTGVDASPSQAQLIHANLEPASKGRILMNASVGLHKWAFAKTSPLQVELNASQLDVASLTKLAGKDIPVSGTLNTHVNLHGSEENLVGNGTLSVTHASAYSEPIQSVHISFSGKGDQAQANLSIRLPAGTVQSNLTVWPKENKYAAQVTSAGIAIDKLETVKTRDLGAAGDVAIDVRGQGSFDNPQLTASIQIPSLTIRNQQVANIKLNANVADHVANATLSSAAMHTNIQAKVRVNLTGEYQTDATLDTQNIPLQPIVAVYSPANASLLSGTTELHATVHGPLKNKAALEAHIAIPYLNVEYNNTIRLAAAAPIRADYKNSVLVLQHSSIKGTDTNLEFEGIVPVGNKGPMSLLLKGSVNLQLAQLFDPHIRSSGEVRFNINSHGMDAGAIGGEIDVVNANYVSPDMPVGLQNGNGVLKLTTDRINIQSFHGTVGGGDVTASGGVQYRPAMQFNLSMTAKNIRILYPEGMRESIDADIHLAGTTKHALLGGTVNLADISFTPAFDLSSFAGGFSSGVAAPSVGGISQNIHLNLAVRSSNNVNLVSRELSINGSANLQVRGTADNPVILGRINLTGGDMILNGNRFVLSGGTIQFVNPTETQPVVNVDITTNIQQYNISMRFRGPTDHLQTQYSSDPALPKADIIHLLAFGNTTEAAANAPATPANQMAESLVANQVSSQITNRVAKVAGISQLSISPVLGNAQNNQQAGANITVQQRITSNLFITFTDNTAQATQTVQGQYKISPRVSISGTRDPNGGFAVDVIIEREH